MLVYGADADSSEHAACRDLLDEWRSGALPWYATWGIFYEFLRVVTHPRVFRRPWTTDEAWRFLEALRVAAGFDLLVHTSRHAEVARQVLAEVPELRGNLLHDAHTAVLMREHGVRRIYTRDSDFHRFSFLDVVDPVRRS